MTHNDRCAFAKSKRNRCRCSCLGERHGRQGRESEGIPGEKSMSEAMGGEVAEIVRRTAGNLLPATHSPCGHELNANAWLGYPHEGGVADAQGQKWWMYLRCPTCSLDVTYWKVERRLDAAGAQVVV